MDVHLRADVVEVAVIRSVTVAMPALLTSTLTSPAALDLHTVDGTI
jgi:hypothetical protein